MVLSQNFYKAQNAIILEETIHWTLAFFENKAKVEYAAVHKIAQNKA